MLALHFQAAGAPTDPRSDHAVVLLRAKRRLHPRTGIALYRPADLERGPVE